MTIPPSPTAARTTTRRQPSISRATKAASQPQSKRLFPNFCAMRCAGADELKRMAPRPEVMRDLHDRYGARGPVDNGLTTYPACLRLLRSHAARGKLFRRWTRRVPERLAPQAPLTTL